MIIKCMRFAIDRRRRRLKAMTVWARLSADDAYLDLQQILFFLFTRYGKVMNHH